MIETAPRHRAPQGIALGIAIMTIFYLGLWLGLRALFPSPAYRCPAVIAPASVRSPLCKTHNAASPAVCRCRPR